MLYILRYLSVCFGALFISFVYADDKYPTTISLNYALQRAESAHPDIEQARAALEFAESERLDAQSLTGTNVSIRAGLFFVEPSSISLDQTNNDSSIGLFVDKRLYDFGQSNAVEKAADMAIKGERISLASAQNQRRLEIMRRYFDVILADMAYLRDNEDMATAYVALDKARDRRDVGQLSDVDVLALESAYQQVRLKRYRSDNQQRRARSALAIAMNQPGHLPAILVLPELKSLSRPIPDVETLQEIAKNKNPAILAAKARVEAAQARVVGARASDGPVLSGQLALSENSRSIGSRDRARVGLQLNIPLSSGGAVQAAIAKEQASLRRERANLALQLTRIEQAVLDIWLELNNLKAQREQATAQLDYRELYLDQQRAQYELETQTDLGDAMVQISEAQRYLKQTEFDIAYRWAQLDALLGKKVYTGETQP